MAGNTAIASCPHCSYCTDGLPVHICPECGGDTRPPEPVVPPAHWATRSQLIWSMALSLAVLFWGGLLSVPMFRSYAKGYTYRGEDALMIICTVLVAIHTIALFLVLRRRARFATTNPADAAVDALLLLVLVPLVPLILFVLAVPMLGQ